MKRRLAAARRLGRVAGTAAPSQGDGRDRRPTRAGLALAREHYLRARPLLLAALPTDTDELTPHLLAELARAGQLMKERGLYAPHSRRADVYADIRRHVGTLRAELRT
jgi:hypothetical protein